MNPQYQLHHTPQDALNEIILMEYNLWKLGVFLLKIPKEINDEIKIILKPDTNYRKQ